MSKLFYDAVVLILVEYVVLLIEQVSSEHHQERYQYHYEQYSVALTAAYRIYNCIDLGKLLGFSDSAHVRCLLERTDLVGIFCDSEDQV